MNAADMSALFDVVIGDNLVEKDINNNVANVDFSEKIKDIKAVMQSDKSIIEQCLKTAAKTTPKIETITPVKTETITEKYSDEDDNDDLDIPGDVDVDADIASFEKEVNSALEESESTTIVSENTVASEIHPDPKSDNPLGLDQEDYEMFQLIKHDFPRFEVYDGSMSFRDFYKWKVLWLGNLLKRFKLLDIQGISKELHSIPIDHFIGDSYINPDLVQKKLDQSFRCRVRVSTILISIYEQYYAWERCLEMLKSKLWKDHELKGSHRRDGQVIEHASDVELYVSEMTGVLKSGEQIESILKASAESLSRQLTCLQMKEQLGMNLKDNRRPQGASPPRHQLDECDSLDGSVVPVQKTSGAVSPVSYGQVDEISLLGN